MNREYRNLDEPLEIRENPDKDGWTIRGYAAMFNTLSQDLGGFIERIAPGAFARTLKNKARSTRSDIRALFNHDTKSVLGRTSNETLRLGEDERGLWYEVDLNPEDPEHRSVYAKVKRGDISQSSFGFRVVGDDWDKADEGGLPTRTLTEIDLYEVSPVAFPAYLEASVGVAAAARSLGKSLGLSGEPTTIEEVLRAAEEQDTPQEGPSDDTPTVVDLLREHLSRRPL